MYMMTISISKEYKQQQMSYKSAGRDDFDTSNMKALNINRNELNKTDLQLLTSL